VTSQSQYNLHVVSLLPSNRHHRSNDDCLDGMREIIRSVLYAILCAIIVHSAIHAHMNRPNSSVDWVLSRWAHLTVLRFMFVHALCMTVYCMHV